MCMPFPHHVVLLDLAVLEWLHAHTDFIWVQRVNPALVAILRVPGARRKAIQDLLAEIYTAERQAY